MVHVKQDGHRSASTPTAPVQLPAERHPRGSETKNVATPDHGGFLTINRILPRMCYVQLIGDGDSSQVWERHRNKRVFVPYFRSGIVLVAPAPTRSPTPHLCIVGGRT